MPRTLSETIAENLKYVDGVDGILGRFFYLSNPDELRQAIEAWLVRTPEGRAWLDSLGFVDKEAMVQVIAQIESNLKQSNRDLLAKLQLLKAYVNAKGQPDKVGLQQS